MRVRACWEVTEHHSVVVDVPDGMDPEEYLTSAVLAEEEDDSTYDATVGRQLHEFEELD